MEEGRFQCCRESIHAAAAFVSAATVLPSLVKKKKLVGIRVNMLGFEDDDK
jgi:hypothetical protein